MHDRIGDRVDGAAAIEPALRRARQRSCDFTLSLGPAGNGYVAFDRLIRPNDRTLSVWMRRMRFYARDIDDRGQAAYLIGAIARQLVRPLAELWLREGILLPLPPERLSLRLARYRWRHDGESGWGLRIALRLRLSPLASTRPLMPEELEGSTTADTLRATILALLGPVVAALKSRSGLGSAALWRLVADMTAQGFMIAGRDAGREDEARDMAVAIIRDGGAPLANKQTGYVEAVLRDEAGEALDSRWFIARGGCCRWYTCEKGDYCTVCVHRPQEESLALLTDYLRRTQEKVAG